MRDFFRKAGAMPEIAAVLMIVFGLLLVVHPGGAVLLACRIAGLILAVTGFMRILRSLDSWRGPDIQCVLGIALLAAGLLIVFWPEVAVGFAGMLSAVLFFLHGFGNLRKMRSMKLAGDPRWRVRLFFSVFTFLIGLIVLLAPLGSASLLAVCAGLFLIAEGVSELWFLYHSF